VAIERTGLLDDLANDYAKMLADRKASSNIMVVSEVQYRQILQQMEAPEDEYLPAVTKVYQDGRRALIRRRRSRPFGQSILNVEEEGSGELAHRRCVAGTAFDRVPSRLVLRDAHLSKLDPIGYKLNLVAPITHELRPGVPFTPDTLVGVGVHRESGLMVRLVQAFRTDGLTSMHVEVAGGTWHGV
jgi:hypothetical protein